VKIPGETTALNRTRHVTVKVEDLDLRATQGECVRPVNRHVMLVTHDGWDTLSFETEPKHMRFPCFREICDGHQHSVTMFRAPVTSRAVQYKESPGVSRRVADFPTLARKKYGPWHRLLPV